MKNTNRESGQTLVLAALSSMVLLGFMAFAADVGVLLHTKRQMQSAADSAALAGAYELTYTGSYSTAEQEGLADAAKNGFSVASNCPATPNASGPTVCIKEPTTDSNATFNAPGYVEADISAPTPTPFINAFWTWFNPGYTPLTVAARAVAVSAGGGGAPPDCADTLNETAKDAMLYQGSFKVEFPGCPVNNNSSSSDALQFTGGSGTLTACDPGGTNCGSIGVVGGDGGQTGDATPAPTLGISHFGDPLGNRDLSAEIPQLTSASACGPAPANINTAAFAPSWTSYTPAAGQTDPLTGTTTTAPTAFPAYNAVCYNDANITLTTASLPAGGVYVFTGNLTLDGITSPVPTAQSPNGITIVIANGGSLTVSPQANEQINISAPLLNTTAHPNSDLWNGMLIYQAPDLTKSGSPVTPVCTGATLVNCIVAQVGSSSGTYNGIVYAPTAEFFLQDSGGDKNGGIVLNTNLIVGTLDDQTASLDLQCYVCGQEGPNAAGVFTRITLVE